MVLQPTSAVAKYHSIRVYYKKLIWRGRVVDPRKGDGSLSMLLCDIITPTSLCSSFFTRRAFEGDKLPLKGKINKHEIFLQEECLAWLLACGECHGAR